MRILLHMGQGKTGTTALQRALTQHRGRLAEHGVLYPWVPNGAIAHHFLISLCMGLAQIPDHVSRRSGGAQEVRALAEDMLAAIRAEIAHSNPEVLVLSSETLIFGVDAAGKRRLHTLLAKLSPNIQPVIYVREPAALYLARLQEKMRVGTVPLPPAPQKIRAEIEATQEAFGVVPQVCAYESAALIGGDITTDFVTRFLWQQIAPELIEPQRANVGMSAEAILAMSRLRAMVAPGRDWQPEPRSQRLGRLLQQVEMADPRPDKARLKPGLAEAIRRASVDYHWLKSQFGLEFSALDYAQIDGTPVPEHMAAAGLQEIVEIDQARYEDLLIKVIAKAMEGAV